jgi:hypothetical protein
MTNKMRMTMRLCRQALAVAVIFCATPSVAGPLAGHPEGLAIAPLSSFSGDRPLVFVSNETDEGQRTDIFASMTGRCRTLKVAGRDFACRAVGYFHTIQGRANFVIALDDPADDSHIITFSGENAQRALDDSHYELTVDRMLLSTKDRPKADGLPVPFVESSTGICKQLGNFAARQVSSISCSAMDNKGKKYELLFESDGLPITVLRIREGPASIHENPLE